MTTLQTPRYQLPYPAGDERVMDGDNAIGALATAVEGILGAHGDALQNETPWFARSTGPLVLTQAFQIVPGASIAIDPTVPETIFVLGIFDFRLTVAGTGGLLGTINIDGVARPGQATFNMPTAPAYATIPYSILIGVNPGHRIIDLRARKESAGGTGSVESGGLATNLMLIRFPTTITRAIEAIRQALPDATPAEA